MRALPSDLPGGLSLSFSLGNLGIQVAHPSKYPGQCFLALKLHLGKPRPHSLGSITTRSLQELAFYPIPW